MGKINPRAIARKRRQARVRKKVLGTTARPRLCVFRSLTNIYAQIIDDEQGLTIVSTSTLDETIKEQVKSLKKTEAAKIVGKSIAELAKEKGFTKVVFDRNGFLYHGRVKALSEAAREAGLDF